MQVPYTSKSTSLREGIAVWCTVRSVERSARLSGPTVRLERHIIYNISIFLSENSCINTYVLIKRMTEICKGGVY